MRLTWPFPRRPASSDGDDALGTVEPPALTPRPTAAWAALPPLRRTVTDMPLVAPPAPFLAAVPGTRHLPPILEPLGHDVNPLATPGLVVATVRPQAGAAASGESGRQLPPVQRRRASTAGTHGPDGGPDRETWTEALDPGGAQDPGLPAAAPAGAAPPAPAAALPEAPPPRSLAVVPTANTQREDRSLTSAAAAAAPVRPGPVPATAAINQRNADGTPAGLRSAPSMRHAAPATPATTAAQRSATGGTPARTPLATMPGPSPADAEVRRRRPGLGAPIAAIPVSKDQATAGPDLAAGRPLVPGHGQAAPASSRPGTIARSVEGSTPPAASAEATDRPAPGRSVLPLAGLPIEAVAGRAAPTEGFRVRPIAGRAPGRPVGAQRIATNQPLSSTADEPGSPVATPWPIASTGANAIPEPRADRSPSSLEMLHPIASSLLGGEPALGGVRSVAPASMGPGVASPLPTVVRPIPASPGPSVQRPPAPALASLPLVGARRPGEPTGPGLPDTSTTPGSGPLTVQTGGRLASSSSGPAAAAVPGPLFMPTATPVVQRIEGAPPVADEEPTGRTAQDLEELARALFGRFRTQLKTELIHDREAKGLTFDDR